MDVKCEGKNKFSSNYSHMQFNVLTLELTKNMIRNGSDLYIQDNLCQHAR